MTPLEAIARARAAWEQSQPQLIIELWPDSGLEGPSRGGLDGSSSPPSQQRRPNLGRVGGLTDGAGPAARDNLADSQQGLSFAPVRLSPEGRVDRRQ